MEFNFCLETFSTYALPTAGLFLYLLYLRKFRIYNFNHRNEIKNSTRPRGKCPPFFPNGWYRIMNSCELKVNQVKYLDYCNRDVVVFRGSNGQVYALEAFCAHMGANLGINGQVKHSKCIQCPFHGWLFDGETGNCIQPDAFSKKAVNQFEYFDLKRQQAVDGEYLKHCYDGNIKMKKYHVREHNECIHIWYDSREKFQDESAIMYHPFKVEHKLEYRGESVQFVNCHIQEIPENGADIRHFDFLHTEIVKGFSLVRFHWAMQSERATRPDLLEFMSHKHEFINEHKRKLFANYLNDENKPFINIINLNAYLVFFGKWKVFFFNGTGFQVGPGLVYLFLKSKYFEIIFAQSVTPYSKFYQRLSHRIYTNWYIPYALSAGALFGEVQQVFNDMAIWNNKVFGHKLSYNLKTEADKKLLAWRNWYSQFYEGCHEYEQKTDKLDW